MEETPLRRSTDVQTEANAQRRHDILMDKVEYAGKQLFHHLMIAASVTVLVLAFQVWQTLKRIDTGLVSVANEMVRQNAELERIHQAIHTEGDRARDKK